MNGDNMSGNGGGSGSLIGSIIVVIILIVGAIYLFSQKAAAPETPAPAQTETNETGVTPAETPVTQESLDADANMAAMDASTLDSDVAVMNKSL